MLFVNKFERGRFDQTAMSESGLSFQNLLWVFQQWILRRTSLFCSIFKAQLPLTCHVVPAPLEQAGIYNKAFRQRVLPDMAGQKYPVIHLGRKISCDPLGQTKIFAVFLLHQVCKYLNRAIEKPQTGHCWWRSSSWVMQCNVESIFVRLQRLVFLFSLLITEAGIGNAQNFLSDLFQSDQEEVLHCSY